MNIDLHLKASIFSSFIELAITHPIDYLKTLKQNNIKNSLSILKQNPYVGIKSKLYGNLPMRLIFWNSIEYGKNNNLSKIESSLLGASLQTIIDYPIEIYKINKMNKNSLNKLFLPSFGFHYLRNVGFTLTFITLSSINPALAGLTGALITQPLDSLKTYYQSGNIKYPTTWNLKDYFKGGMFRCSISFISMGIGSYVFNQLK
jgi:hypothetical protein